jgi:hypothetical protein
MDNGIGLQCFNKPKHSLSVADIDFVVHEIRNGTDQPLLIPSCVPLRTKKFRALVVIHPMQAAAPLTKEQGDFGADETG